MNIAETLEAYERIAEACEKAIDENKNLIDEADRWLPNPWTWDFNYLHASEDGEYIYGSASVWTNQTGGSNEEVEFRIPIATINRFLDES